MDIVVIVVDLFLNIKIVMLFVMLIWIFLLSNIFVVVIVVLDVYF